MSKEIKCLKCNRSWKEECQQTQCIKKYGRCIVCLARDNPIAGLDWKEVSDFLKVNLIKITKKGE